MTFPLAGGGPQFPTRDEALKQLVSKAVWSAHTVYLTNSERKRACEFAGSKVSGVVRSYQAMSKKGAVLAWAFLDTHRVRSKRESLLFAIAPDGTILGSRVLGFDEPREYLPPGKWLQRLDGWPLNDNLHLKKGIDGITGATLSSRAAVNAARRSLALWKVLQERNEPN